MKRKSIFLLTLFLSTILVFSCSKKGEEKTKEAVGKAKPAEEKLKYVSEEVSFVVAFDEDGKERTIKLSDKQDKLDIYIIINFPETMQISASEFRLVLPEGVEIESDSFYKKRLMSLGTFEKGISEAFVCTAGPKLVLHKLGLRVTKKLSNAEIALMPSNQDNFIGIATCDEGNPRVTASSYKAVINPVD